MVLGIKIKYMWDDFFKFSYGNFFFVEEKWFFVFYFEMVLIYFFVFYNLNLLRMLVGKLGDI